MSVEWLELTRLWCRYAERCRARSRTWFLSIVSGGLLLLSLSVTVQRRGAERSLCTLAFGGISAYAPALGGISAYAPIGGSPQASVYMRWPMRIMLTHYLRWLGIRRKVQLILGHCAWTGGGDDCRSRGDSSKQPGHKVGVCERWYE